MMLMGNGKASSSNHEVALSPAARLFHAPRFNCCIIAIIGFKTPINPNVFKAGLEHTLLKHPRFSSKLTINDVVVGVTQAGLSRYLNRRYGEEQKDGRVKKRKTNIPKGTRFRATILVNLRKTVGIQDLADMMAKGSKIRWGNLIGYWLLPFNTALQDDPLEYVRQTKAAIDRKKLSREAICTYSFVELVLRTFGAKVAAAITHRAISNTTMAISSLVGPQEEISFYGHPLAYLAPYVYGHPHALTFHIQSYMNKMTLALSVDPSVIPDPHLLCDDLEESLKLIRDAVVKKGLIKDIV